MPTYVALLRGINVGGNKKVPMADLKRFLEKSGYENVKTVLASGNVLFDAAATDIKKLRATIETLLEKKFGFPIPTILRKKDDLAKLVHSAPFKKIRVTPATRLYVTFLTDKRKATLKIPYESPEKDFRILTVSSTEVCSVLELNPNMRSVDSMQILEKEFGKNVTTRNWNTIEKLLR